MNIRSRRSSTAAEPFYKLGLLFLIMAVFAAASQSIRASATFSNIDYPASTPASAFTLNGDTKILGDHSLQLTALAQNSYPDRPHYDPTVQQRGSVFFNTPENVAQFNTTFRFRLTPDPQRGDEPWADGITFVIQNQGANALGEGGSEMGYGGYFGTDGIQPSVALKFKTFALGDPNNGGDPSQSTVGVLVNGQDSVGTGIGLTDLLAYGPDFDLGNGDTFRANVVYANGTMSLTLTNENTGHVVSLRFAVNIPAFVGGNTAYVGFGGGTGLYISDQRILSWQYTPSGSVTAPVRPTITSISPASANVGSPALQMTINGSGFGGAPVVRFDNTTMPLVSISNTSVVINVPASFLTAKRTYNVTVSAGSATSNAVPFRVTTGVTTGGAPILKIVGVFRTGLDMYSGNRYAVLLIQNSGSADITNLNFSNVRLYINGGAYLTPVNLTLEPGASPPGNLTVMHPGERLQARWDFTNAPMSGSISIQGTSDQGAFNAGMQFLIFP